MGRAMQETYSFDVYQRETDAGSSAQRTRSPSRRFKLFQLPALLRAGVSELVTQKLGMSRHNRAGRLLHLCTPPVPRLLRPLENMVSHQIRPYVPRRPCRARCGLGTTRRARCRRGGGSACWFRRPPPVSSSPLPSRPAAWIGMDWIGLFFWVEKMPRRVEFMGIAHQNTAAAGVSLSDRHVYTTRCALGA